MRETKLRQWMNARHFWFKCSICIGLLLSVLLLIETLATYRYVERDLVHEEAQREAERGVRSIVRAARLMGIGPSSDVGRVLREVAHENPNQIAWIRVVASDGHIIAASTRGDEVPKYSRNALRTLMDQHRPREWKTASGRVLVVLAPFVLRSAEHSARSPSTGRPPEPEFIEVAMYVNSISVNFGPLRQNLIVGLSAAFAFLGAVIVIGLRFGDYVRTKQVEKELALARQVQADLFPTEGSLALPIQFAARCVPAWQVGGDLYDVFETHDGETALVLGDVSGKGLSAALLIGLVQGALRASCAAGAAMNCEQRAEHLNDLLCAKTARERFVSLFWCCFNARTGTLGYVNAGHCPALLMRGGAQPREILRLEAGGPVLGALPGSRYEHGEVMVQAGDLLVIFSDGIIEAADADQQEFGEEGLVSVIERNWSKSPAEMCQVILANVKAFVGDKVPHDDQTLVIARLEPAEMKRITSAHTERVMKAQAVGI
jgi:hypothetical protein